MVRPRNYCSRMPGKGERCRHRECPYWTNAIPSHCLRKERIEQHPLAEEGDLGELANIMKSLLAKEGSRDLR